MQRNPQVSNYISRSIEALRIDGNYSDSLSEIYTRFHELQSQYNMWSKEISEIWMNMASPLEFASSVVIDSSERRCPCVESPQLRELEQIIETIDVLGESIWQMRILIGSNPKST
ncbi:hypothetical protein K3495_g10237 [Podosphaera aphanis]|nr:hypothetical protein K3495_g10237 [Podosphaera aphanis]